MQPVTCARESWEAGSRCCLPRFADLASRSPPISANLYRVPQEVCAPAQLYYDALG